MQPPSSAPAGQISADGQFRWDGQQWVPLERGYREPTPWTRPMQLATAALLAFQAVTSVALTFIYVNHDSMLKAMQAQGTQIPSGMSIDSLVNAALVGTYVFIVCFSLLELFAAIGSFLRWRWMFWAALVLVALLALLGLLNLPALFRADSSAVPIGATIFDELLSALDLVLAVWMIAGAIKYGPWAMRRPGGP